MKKINLLSHSDSNNHLSHSFLGLLRHFHISPVDVLPAHTDRIGLKRLAGLSRQMAQQLEAGKVERLLTYPQLRTVGT